MSNACKMNNTFRMNKACMMNNTFRMNNAWRANNTFKIKNVYEMNSTFQMNNVFDMNNTYIEQGFLIMAIGLWAEVRLPKLEARDNIKVFKYISKLWFVLELTCLLNVDIVIRFKLICIRSKTPNGFTKCNSY